MKQSHYTTPRSLDNAEFQPWGQAIFPEERPGFHADDLVVIWACAGAALALAAMAVVGWLS